jgi:hypothetical protein
VSIRAHPWLKKAFLPNEPKWKITSHCPSVGCVKSVWLRFPKRTHFSLALAFQRDSKRFKGFEEKNIFSRKLGGLGTRLAADRPHHFSLFDAGHSNTARSILGKRSAI